MIDPRLGSGRGLTSLVFPPAPSLVVCYLTLEPGFEEELRQTGAQCQSKLRVKRTDAPTRSPHPHPHPTHIDKQTLLKVYR